MFIQKYEQGGKTFFPDQQESIKKQQLPHYVTTCKYEAAQGTYGWKGVMLL